MGGPPQGRRPGSGRDEVLTHRPRLSDSGGPTIGRNRFRFEPSRDGLFVSPRGSLVGFPVSEALLTPRGRRLACKLA